MIKRVQLLVDQSLELKVYSSERRDILELQQKTKRVVIGDLYREETHPTLSIQIQFYLYAELVETTPH